MEVRFTKSATKELAKIGPARANIMAKIKQYAVDPASLANKVTDLKGRDEFRLRVGEHRILFILEHHDDGTLMVVTAVRHRRHAYD